MHIAMKPWEYQVLSYSLYSYMDYYTSLLTGFSTFNFSTSSLFSTYCYYDLSKIHVDPFPKTQPALSSPVELNFLFVDMTFKVFINSSQLTTSASSLTSAHLIALAGQLAVPW